MKKLGQHFLIDESFLDRLVKYGGVSGDDVVLEVGAGKGELTWRLAERAGRVIAVELDKVLAREAREKVKGYGNVELLVGDILKLKPTGFNKVVSNPPYQISTKLLRWLITSLPERIVLTLQREFVSKLTAPPGSGKYVYTSFLSQLLYQTKVVERVPRTTFRPIPRVDSAIIIMERARRELPGKDELMLVKLLFTKRRRTLRRVLIDISKRLGIDMKEIEGSISSENLSRRIYTLNPSELISCANTLIRIRAGR